MRYRLFVIILLLYTLVAISYSETSLKGCADLSTSGETYTLSSSISTTVTTCFTVSASDVTLDCNGNSVVFNGSLSESTTAISTSADNFHLVNCTISNWGYGLVAGTSNLGAGYRVYVNDSEFDNNLIAISAHGGDVIRTKIHGSNKCIFNTMNTLNVKNSSISNCSLGFDGPFYLERTNVSWVYEVFKTQAKLNYSNVWEFGKLYLDESHPLLVYNSNISEGIELGYLNSTNSTYSRIYYSGIEVSVSNRTPGIGDDVSYSFHFYSLSNFSESESLSYTIYLGKKTLASGTGSSYSRTLTFSDDGLFFLYVKAVDSKDNVRYYGVNLFEYNSVENKTFRYYLRPELNTSNLQPKGETVRSLMLHAPDNTYSFSGDSYLISFIKELPIYFPSILNSTYYYFRYTMNDTGYFYTKFPSFDNSDADSYYVTIQNATSETLVNDTLYDKYYIDDPFSFYFFAYKLGAMNSTSNVYPTWITENSKTLSDPSFFDMKFLFPKFVNNASGDAQIFQYNRSSKKVDIYLKVNSNYILNLTLPTNANYFVICNGGYSCDGLSYSVSDGTILLNFTKSGSYDLEIKEGCTCDSCSSCTNALLDSSCTTVYLIQDISTTGTCISQNSYENKTFDCQNHKITGDGGAGDFGIYLDNSENILIKDCDIEYFDVGIVAIGTNITATNCTLAHMPSAYYSVGFLAYTGDDLNIYDSEIFDAWYGVLYQVVNGGKVKNNIIHDVWTGGNSQRNASVYIDNSSNINVTNNELYGFGVGVRVTDDNPGGNRVGNSYNILVKNNHIHDNQWGIYFENSTASEISQNWVCNNSNYDIYFDLTAAYTASSDDTCNTVYHFDDTDYTGCRWPCNSTCTCSSCNTCNNYLAAPHSCQTTILNESIISDDYICLNVNLDKTFDCNGSQISSATLFYTTGVSISDDVDLTLQNCIIYGFEKGIKVNGILHLINSTISNNWIGVFIDDGAEAYTNNVEVFGNNLGFGAGGNYRMYFDHTNFTDNFCSLHFPTINEDIHTIAMNSVLFDGVPGYSFSDGTYTVDSVGFLISEGNVHVSTSNINLKNKGPSFYVLSTPNLGIGNIIGEGSVWLGGTEFPINTINISRALGYGLHAEWAAYAEITQAIFRKIIPYDEINMNSVFVDSLNDVMELTLSHAMNFTYSSSSIHPKDISYVEMVGGDFSSGNFKYIDSLYTMLTTLPIFSDRNIELNFTAKYPNNSLCTDFTYEVFLGGENVTSYATKSGSTITLDYTVDSDGYYNVTLILYENGGNIKVIHSWPVIVGDFKFINVTYYVNAEEPTYAQPSGLYSRAFGKLTPYKPYRPVVLSDDNIVYMIPNEVKFTLPSFIYNVYYSLNYSATGSSKLVTIERIGTFYSSGGSGTFLSESNGSYQLSKTISTPFDLFWIFVKFESYSVLNNVKKPGYPKIYSSYDYPSRVAFEYAVPSFLIDFESPLDLSINYIKKGTDYFKIKAGSPINISLNVSEIATDTSKVFVKDGGSICPGAHCDFVISGEELNISFDSPNEIYVGVDNSPPTITSSNERYVNSSSFTLNFTTNDNVKSFSYLDFNRSLQLALNFDKYLQTLEEDSTYGRTAILGSTTSKDRNDPIADESIWGNALWFDGYNTYVHITDSISTEDGITVSAWVRPENYENTGWPMFGGGIYHTGLINDTLSSNDVLWISDLNYTVLAQPVYGDGKIFVGTFNMDGGGGEFVAFDAETGNRIWSKNYGLILSTPAVYDGKVYLVDTNNVLHALSTADGSEVWNHTFNLTYGGLVVEDGVLYIAEKNHYLYAFNATNGQLIWQVEFGEYDEGATPTIIGNKITAVSLHERAVKFFDKNSGRLLYTVKVGDSGDTSTVVTDGKALFVTTTYNSSGHLYVIDEYGYPICNVSLNDETTTDYFPPAPVVDDKYVFVSWSHGIYAFYKYNCTPVWNITGDESKGVDMVSPIANGNYLFVSQKDGKVHQYYKENGTEVWSYDVGENYTGILLVNQRLYFGGNGSFYAIGEKRSSISTIYLLGSQSNTVGYHWLYFYKGYNGLRWQYTNGTKYKVVSLSNSIDLFDGNWHLVTVTHNYTSREVRLYVDGQLQDVESTDAVLPVSNKESYVGTYRTYAHFFKGDIDQVMVWNQPITSEEASALYDSTNKSIEIPMNLEDGDYNYIFNSMDEVGNRKYVMDSFTVDTVSPTVTLVSPENDSCNSKNVLLNSTVSEDTLNEFIYNISNGLVSYFNFDEARGNVVHDLIQNLSYEIHDVNSSNYDGDTLPNWTDGKFAYGLKFDGVDDIAYYEFNDISDIPYSTSTLTISLWMKPIGCDSPWSRGCGVFGGFGDSYWCDGFGIFWNDNNNQTYVVFGYNLDGARDPITYNHYKYLYDLYANVGKDEWHMLTVVYDLPHRNLSVYVDGDYVASREIEKPYVLGTRYLHIGAAGISPYWATSQYAKENVTFNGTLDQILIWNRALTPKEIKELYNYTYPLHAQVPVLENNLIAHFHFDEGSGNAYDDTKNGYVVSLHDNAEWGVGKFGSGIHFNGNESYAVVDNSANLTGDEITLAFWAKIDKFSDVNTYYYFLDKGYSEGYKVYYYSDGRIDFRIHDSADNFLTAESATGVLDEGKWHFIVATYNKYVLKLFVDGELVAYLNASGYPVKRGNVNLMIGHVYYDSNDDHTLNGTIDELMVFNRSLSDLEVESLYYSELYRYYDDLSNVPDGKYYVETISTDYAGNKGNSQNVTFFVDTEAPLFAYNSEDDNGTNICTQTEEINIIPIDLTDLEVYSKYVNAFTGLKSKDLILNLPFNEINSTYNGVTDLSSNLNFSYSGAFSQGNLGNLIADFEKTKDDFSSGPYLYVYYIDGKSGYAAGVSSSTVNLTYLYKNVTGSYKANYTIWFYGKGYVNAGLYNGSDYVSYIEDVATGCKTPIGETAIYNYCNDGNAYTEWHLFKIFKPNETSSDVVLRLMNGNKTTSKYSGQYDYVVDGPIFVNDSFGSGLKFDGYRQKVVVPYPAELEKNFTTFSVEVWFNSSPVQMKSQSNLVTFGTWRNRVTEYGGKVHIEFFINGSTITWKKGQTVPQGEPVHLVVVYNGSAVIDYVNGNKEVYNDSVSGPLDLSIGTYDLIFGSESPSDYSWPFNGTIYTVRFYNKSLSDDEVNELYHGKKIYDNLIAEWNFDEFDHSYKVYDQHPVESSIERKGAYFDGYNDYYSAEVNDSWKLQRFTFEAWVKFDNNAGSTWGAILRGPFGTGYGSGWRLLARVSSGKAQYLFQLNNGTTPPQAVYSSLYPLDEWHFVAGTYDGNQMCLYVDGELDGCTSATGGVNYDGSYPIMIGGAQYKLNGIIDDVLIYNRALSADEIENDYHVLRDKYNVILRATSEGWKNFDVKAIDCCNNLNYLNLSYKFISEDVKVDNIWMNNSHPKEGENVRFYATFSNPGWLVSHPDFELSIYAYDGSNWYLVHDFLDDQGLELAPNETHMSYTDWVAKPCRYKFVAKAIPDTEECNYSDNEMELIFDVPAWATIYGNLSSKLLLGTSESDTMYEWNPAKVSNVYVADADSAFLISELEPVSSTYYTKSLDNAINMSGCQDSVTNLWDSDGDDVFDMYHTFIIGGESKNVPSIYSDNSHNFFTGLLYDPTDISATAGDKDYVFVGNVRKSSSDYGEVDYVIKVPSNLQDLKGSNRELYLYLEIT